MGGRQLGRSCPPTFMMFLFISRHMMTRVYAHAYVHVGQMLVRMRDIRVL